VNFGPNWIIKSARVIDPSSGLDETGDLLVRDGRVASVGETVERDDAVVIDGRGLIVCPGLIDVHVHLREPDGEHKETIETGSRAAAAGGFTTVCCMPNTNPAIDNVNTVRLIAERSAASNNCRVHPIAAITKARQGRQLTDFKSLIQAGAVAFSDDGDGIEDDSVMRSAFVLARELDTLIIQHCEFKELSKRGVMHLGDVSRRLGLVGYDPIAEERMIERDIALVAETGARYHVAHISSAGGVELVRDAKRRGLPVTTEVCPHHLLLCDEDVVDDDGRPDPNFKMSPPLRSRGDVEACVAGVIDGTIDCIVTDHAPHTTAEKQAGFVDAPMGIVGLETSLGCAAKALVGRNGFDWPDLISRMSTAPAKRFKLPGGTLTVGEKADITVIDPKADWKVDPDQFQSKSHNTPFAGWRLPAKAVATILEGRITHADQSLSERITQKM